MFGLGFWQTIKLILKHWPQVVAFVKIADKAVDKAILNSALNQLRESFDEDNTIEEVAESAGNLDDSFRN
jgi:hypothetical protein